MLADNQTPFAAIGFEQRHRDGAAMAVIAVRGGFFLTYERRLHRASHQRIVLADEYAGDPHRTPLLVVTDVIPWKPFADVTVLGTAHAPEGRPTPSWTAAVRVGDCAHTLRVHGARAWEPAGSADGFRPGAAKDDILTPIDYRLAAGGALLGADGEVEARNPIGPGVLDRRHTPADARPPMPRIDSEAEPVDAPFARPEPQGFGPVPPWWSWRQKYAGTYDEAWIRDRHPALPLDFDYRFYQVAHPRLILPRYLVGDEGVRIDGLSRRSASVAFRLPRLVPYARFRWADGREVKALLQCDGLHVDARTEPWLVDLTWRGWIACGRGFSSVHVHLAAQGDGAIAGLPSLGLHGLEDGEVRS
jgi:hypothetical protein